MYGILAGPDQGLVTPFRMDSDSTLDVRGLSCPLPLLKAKQALNGMKKDLVLKVLCTDPGSVRDFQVFSEQSGHKILKSMETNKEFHYWIKKAG